MWWEATTTLPYLATLGEAEESGFQELGVFRCAGMRHIFRHIFRHICDISWVYLQAYLQVYLQANIQAYIQAYLQEYLQAYLPTTKYTGCQRHLLCWTSRNPFLELELIGSGAIPKIQLVSTKRLLAYKQEGKKKIPVKISGWSLWECKN